RIENIMLQIFVFRRPVTPALSLDGGESAGCTQPRFTLKREWGPGGAMALRTGGRYRAATLLEDDHERSAIPPPPRQPGPASGGGKGGGGRFRALRQGGDRYRRRGAR